MSEPTKETRARWAKMARWERAVDNVAHWEAELDKAKHFLRIFKAKAARLKAELEPLSVLESAC